MRIDGVVIQLVVKGSEAQQMVVDSFARVIRTGAGPENKRPITGLSEQKFTGGLLEGAFLEQVLPPNGTDRSPYFVRDIATTFVIQAACRMVT